MPVSGPATQNFIKTVLHLLGPTFIPNKLPVGILHAGAISYAHDKNFQWRE
jgi:hypothetical protein